jgi:hypothetical protein
MGLDHLLKISPPRNLKKESLKLLKTELQLKGVTSSEKPQVVLHPTSRAPTTPTPTRTPIQVMKKTRTI